MVKKKTIFLTGASGSMGKATLKHLLERTDRFDIVALVLPTQKDKEVMAQFENSPALKIVWGDLTNYDDVLKCVQGSNIVLHIGAVIPPLADHKPELATKVNVGGTKNVVKAIQAQPNKDSIKLIYIGSAGQTGDRNMPIHWGRTGDPIKINVYDNYSITKTLAEKEVIESGLKYWVSIRHTGLLHLDVNAGMDPLMFRQPIDGVMEWSIAPMSGLALANACEDWVSEEFWRRIYNLGGGEKYRTTNYEFMKKTFDISGMGDIKKVMNLNWFTTRNSQGQWYVDSDILEDYLKFRSGSIDDFLQNIIDNLPPAIKLVKLIPSTIIKKFVFEPLVNKETGPMYWIKNNNQEKIKVYFGSKEKWNKIPAWKDYVQAQPSKTPILLKHGYDESKPKSQLSIEDMRQAAKFRGGECLSDTMVKGDLYTKLKWKCAFGHEFEASPTLVLLGGHWCPDCLPAPWNYEEEAKVNPFLAQVWYPLHDK